MNQLIKLSALSLLFLSQSGFSKSKNCLIVLVGGGKEWTSLLPFNNTDISIDVHQEASKQARNSGCRVISGHNQNEKEFKEMIKKSAAPPFFTKNTSVHMVFTDHGAPQGENGVGSLYIGMEHYIRNEDLADTLKENFPKNTRLTFSTNICYGSMSEIAISNKLDSHFDICGSSSTNQEHLSWNRRDLSLENKELRGPYTAVGLAYAAKAKQKGQQTPSMFDFHQKAKNGDYGNIFKIPGYTSTVSFARSILRDKNLRAEVDHSPMPTLLDSHLPTPTISENLDEISLSNLKSQILKALGEECLNVKTSEEFEHFFKNFSKIYDRLSSVNPQDLIEPYKSQAIASSKWLKYNQKNLAGPLSQIVKAKLDFWEKNKKRLLDPLESKKLKEEWRQIEEDLRAPLKPFLYHMRNLQEARTIADFFIVANPEEKKRFDKFRLCESRPVF